MSARKFYLVKEENELSLVEKLQENVLSFVLKKMNA